MLAETIASRDSQGSAAPKVLKRCLGRVPFPPAAARLLFVLAHIRSSDRAVVADMTQYRFELFVKVMPLPAFPAGAQGIRIAPKAKVPMTIEWHRYDRGVMGPVFEQGPVDIVQTLEVFGPIGGASCKQDQVMRPRNGVDAVQLHKAKPLNQGVQIRTLARAAWRIRQVVALHEDPPRCPVVQFERGYHRFSVSP